ncbi:MAG: bacterial transcriptional activator domain-containing protein [Atopobiaceae bacterium]|nr:bacterial transcriptional activator domain-containing protein [Atopobiaceae bacterium]
MPSDETNGNITLFATEDMLPDAVSENLDQTWYAEDGDTVEPRLLILCAGPGMGKTAKLSQMVLQHLTRGAASRYYDFASVCPEELPRKMRDVARWAASSVRGSLDKETRPFVAIDNLVVGDECDVDRVVSILRRILGEGSSIALAILPEGETLVERLGEAQCRWACDLRVARPLDANAAEWYDLYTLGVPLLVSTLAKMAPVDLHAIPSDLSYQESYVSMVESMDRPQMMDEEKRLRCGLMLLGNGSKEEVYSVIGNTDETLWRAVARDEPFLGVDIAANTFCCAGGHSMECLNVAYSALCSLVQPWPVLVANACDVLASRGDYARAAIVSLMCSDVTKKCMIGLAWGIRMIDAGEVSVATDALETARGLGLRHLDGFAETSCILAALGIGEDSIDARALISTPHGINARIVALALRSRALLRGKCLDEEIGELLPQERSDPLAEALATHAKALYLMLHGRLGEAYDLLLASPLRFESSSISAALVTMDYAFCSLLVGVLPGPLDREALDVAREFFERSGLTQYLSLLDASLAMGRLLGGKAATREAFEAHVQRAARSKDTILSGLFLIASGVADLRVGALTRGHVRLEQAERLFEEVSARELAVVSHLLDIAVRAQLGERVLSSEIKACKGVSKGLDKLVEALLIALTTEGDSASVVAGGMRMGPVCPRDIYWVANVLCNDCNAVSYRFMKTLPFAWSNSILRSSSEIDSNFDGPSMGLSLRTSAQGVMTSEVMAQGVCKGKPVEVRMLGGFEVYAGGSAVPINRLDRRKGKALLALLTAMPGHVAKRYNIMESLWQTYDYPTANKCLYSATSVLRAELGAALGGNESPNLVVANKGAGTVALNTVFVGCDIDVFEEQARKLIDMEGVDNQAVALCREVEDLYRGDLFVPPTDGMGIISARALQLKELYADAMLAGATAASNLGMKSLACRFARKAQDADELREDAIRMLVVTLCATGRHIEAERRYERFVGRVVDLTKRPPSRRLRELVDSVLRDSPVGTRPRRPSSPGSQPKVHVLKEAEPIPAQLSFGFDDGGAGEAEGEVG